MLYKNGINLNSKLSEYLVNSQKLFIFSAYIKLETLTRIIDNQSNVNSVFVRLNDNPVSKALL